MLLTLAMSALYILTSAVLFDLEAAEKSLEFLVGFQSNGYVVKLYEVRRGRKCD